MIEWYGFLLTLSLSSPAFPQWPEFIAEKFLTPLLFEMLCNKWSMQLHLKIQWCMHACTLKIDTPLSHYCQQISNAFLILVYLENLQVVPSQTPTVHPIPIGVPGIIPSGPITNPNSSSYLNVPFGQLVGIWAISDWTMPGYVAILSSTVGSKRIPLGNCWQYWTSL